MTAIVTKPAIAYYAPKLASDDLVADNLYEVQDPVFDIEAIEVSIESGVEKEWVIEELRRLHACIGHYVEHLEHRVAADAAKSRLDNELGPQMEFDKVADEMRPKGSKRPRPEQEI